MWIRKLVHTEGIFESPIDLNIAKMEEIELPLLEWVNFEIPPKKMKVTNTGHTSELSYDFLTYQRYYSMTFF